MAELKTRPTAADVDAFIAAIADPARRADAQALLTLLGRASGCVPRLWGSSIVGFGSYHYRYDSGREGDAAMIGFSPRKANLVVYVADGFPRHATLMARLGRYKTGKSCLYLRRLADVDAAVLEELAAESVALMRATYPTTD